MKLAPGDEKFTDQVNILMNIEFVDHLLKEGKYPPIMNFLEALPNKSGYPVLPHQANQKHTHAQTTN